MIEHKANLPSKLIMLEGKVFYKNKLAGIITETDDGEYVFQYETQYVKDYPKGFITFTMPVTNKPYKDKRLFAFLYRL